MIEEPKTSAPAAAGGLPEASLVDEALATNQANGNRKKSGSGPTTGVTAREELDALRSEVSRLRESAGELASGSVRVARLESREVLDDVAARIRRNPLTAAAIVGAIAYIWGATR